MREIKFRAWNGKDMVMPQLLYDKTRFRFQMTQEAEYSWRTSRWADSLEIMQYTGLKDKNAVDIYEFDVFMRNGWPLVVTWDKDRWICKAHSGGHTVQLHIDPRVDWCCRDYEVIGNIYENPELLGAGE